jgi:cysteine desulfurase
MHLMKKRIYLDNHSTTPVDPRVLEVMLPFFADCFGNAASTSHSFGREAERAVELARSQIASLIGAKPEEIIFTSGATESDNLALKGGASALLNKGNHIITSNIEHGAVLNTCRTLEQRGFRVTYVPVDTCGLIDPSDVAKAFSKETILVSIMHANNEIGAVQSVEEIGKICKERGVVFHTDAAQSAAKIPVDVETYGVDLLSLSAHKFYGPKGIGALYVRNSNPPVRIEPMIDGGGHERGLRPGTLNVPAIVGFGEACAIAAGEENTERDRVRELRDRLMNGLISQLDEVHLNGDLERRLPGNLNVSFGGVAGHSLLTALDGEIAVSSGSACSSGSLRYSHVLKAIGRSDELIDSSIRFGIGRFNTKEEIDYTVKRLSELIDDLPRVPPKSVQTIPGS